MAGNGTRRSRAQETRLAAATGGAVVPYSGAGKVKGDVHTPHVFYEAKSSARKAADGSKSIGVKKDDLTKMLAQQQKEGKALHAMHLHFAADRNDWVVMSWVQWLALLGAWEATEIDRPGGFSDI